MSKRYINWYHSKSYHKMLCTVAKTHDNHNSFCLHCIASWYVIFVRKMVLDLESLFKPHCVFIPSHHIARSFSPPSYLYFYRSRSFWLLFNILSLCLYKYVECLDGVTYTLICVVMLVYADKFTEWLTHLFKSFRWSSFVTTNNVWIAITTDNAGPIYMCQGMNNI